MKTHLTVLAALLVAPALLAEPTVTRVFRTVRDARGDENVRRVQDIDDAAWVWAPGHEVWGVSADSNAWNVRFGMKAAPNSFFRFRNRFIYNFIHPGGIHCPFIRDRISDQNSAVQTEIPFGTDHCSCLFRGITFIIPCKTAFLAVKCREFFSSHA